MASVFRSYAQNQEDVVLGRIFQDISHGHYVEVGAGHPTIKSVSYALYMQGWDGILIDPQHDICDLIRKIRPRDKVVEMAISDSSHKKVPFYITPRQPRSTLLKRIAEAYGVYKDQLTDTITLDEILSEHPWAKDNLHYLVLDVEGAEKLALKGLNLKKYRPWVLIIESTHPITHEDTSAEWEQHVLSSGYTLSHYDGVSKFYIAKEHDDLLKRSYPACSTDSFILDFPPVPFDPDECKLNTETAELLANQLRKTGSGYDKKIPIKKVTEYLQAVDEDKARDIEEFIHVLQVALSRSRINKDQ